MARTLNLLLSCLLVMMYSSGCDQVAKMAEQGDQPPADSAPADPTLPPPLMADSPAQAAATRTPQQIIDAFLALPNHERTDARLLEVTSLSEGLDQLTELDLSQSPVTDTGLADVAKLTNLQTLNLSNTRITNAVFAQIVPLAQLDTLLLESVPGVDGTALSTIKEVKALRVLKLSGTVVGDEAVMQTTEMPNLQVLHMIGCRNMVGKGFSNLAQQGKYKELRELAISDTSFGTYGLEHIGSLTSLEVLYAQSADLNDGTFRTIGACSNLRELHIQGNSFAPASLKTLGRLKQLEVLRIDRCAGVVDSSFDFLKALKQLKLLGLDGCPCTPPAVELLKTKFLMNTTIVYGGREL